MRHIIYRIVYEESDQATQWKTKCVCECVYVKSINENIRSYMI